MCVCCRKWNGALLFEQHSAGRCWLREEAGWKWKWELDGGYDFGEAGLTASVGPVLSLELIGYKSERCGKLLPSTALLHNHVTVQKLGGT